MAFTQTYKKPVEYGKVILRGTVRVLKNIVIIEEKKTALTVQEEKGG